MPKIHLQMFQDQVKVLKFHEYEDMLYVHKRLLGILLEGLLIYFQLYIRNIFNSATAWSAMISPEQMNQIGQIKIWK